MLATWQLLTAGFCPKQKWTVRIPIWPWKPNLSAMKRLTKVLCSVYRQAGFVTYWIHRWDASFEPFQVALVRGNTSAGERTLIQHHMNILHRMNAHTLVIREETCFPMCHDAVFIFWQNNPAQWQAQSHSDCGDYRWPVHMASFLSSHYTVQSVFTSEYQDYPKKRNKNQMVLYN